MVAFSIITVLRHSKMLSKMVNLILYLHSSLNLSLRIEFFLKEMEKQIMAP